MTTTETGGETDIDAAIDILLVEPSPGDTRLFEENFRTAKLVNDVHVVADGDAAVDFIRQRGDYETAPQPDLVLLEPNLPGTGGMEVLAELNSCPDLGDVPVVVLTSSDVGEDIVKSHGLEADAYIRKPVETDEFVEFVRDVEDFWLAIVDDGPKASSDD